MSLQQLGAPGGELITVTGLLNAVPEAHNGRHRLQDRRVGLSAVRQRPVGSDAPRHVALGAGASRAGRHAPRSYRFPEPVRIDLI